MWFLKSKKPPESLNICIVGARFPILGKGNEDGFLWPLAKGLSDRGHQVTIIAWQNPYRRTELKRDNIRAFFLGEGVRSERRQFPTEAYKKFLELNEQKPFHIVHSLDNSGLLIAADKKSHGVPVMFDVSATQMAQVFSILGMAHETLGSFLSTSIAVLYKFLTTYLKIDRHILNSADGVFVTTPFQKLALDRYYLYPELKTFIVPYGSEYVDLAPRNKSDELRQKLSIPLNSKNVLTVTDMTELNEILELLKAFAKAVVRRPSARLIIVGNGPLYKQIEYEVLNLVLGSKVVFTGPISNEDLPDYIALADIYVNLSSRTSGFEPATLEAMALEKVIIGSELSPISTIIQNGVDGFLIRPADGTTLQNHLISAFDEQLPSERIGKAARKKIIDLFSTDKMTTDLLTGYQRTVSQCGN
jgi:glycosyltransferase involved in cell wall biosynthesis